jgi:hypothetical protein
MLTADQLREKLVREFAAEVEAMGQFAYESLQTDLLKTVGDREFDRLLYAESIGFAIQGMGRSLSARMRFDLADEVGRG